jgi:ATP-dependent DNA helicase RecQ
MDSSRKILRHYWGYENFREGQESIIDDVINGHDVLALLPTGGGKSICYQIPGIAREGVTIVISPLIALMQDQVNILQQKNLKANAIISGMSYKQIDIILDNARFGGIKFLYTSPERIQSSLFIERFKRMPVALIVVDEAHCISEWGHDFRPTYKKIKNLRDYHPNVPVIAVTATANKIVQNEIIQQLGLRNPLVYSTNFERKNLSYCAYNVENKIKAILEYCRTQCDKIGIIYCQTRKSVKFLTRLFLEKGFNPGIYHGGMTKEDRDENLKNWIAENKKLIIATNAFGMGIDKPNVGFVLHYEFPNSIEAYFQEAGRAGRNGSSAESIVYWEENDLILLKDRLEKQFPDEEIIKKCYVSLCNFLNIAIGSGINESYAFDFNKFHDQYKLDINDTYQTLKILELDSKIVFSEGINHSTKMKFAVSNNTLYNFQVNHPKLNSLINYISRSYPGVFDYFFEINEKQMATHLKTSSSEVIAQLQILERYGIIDVTWKSELPTITFLQERPPDQYFSISRESYSYRKQRAFEKLEAALNYLTTINCRSNYLINYLDQNGTDCGTCDNCKRNNSKQAKSKPIDIIRGNLTEPLTFEELMAHLQLGSDELKKYLNVLFLEKQIEIIDNKIHLKNNNSKN